MSTVPFVTESVRGIDILELPSPIQEMIGDNVSVKECGSSHDHVYDHYSDQPAYEDVHDHWSDSN